MKPGRELDALVAEKVMGFKTYKTNNPFDYSGKDKSIYTMSQLDNQGHVEETKQYSTDIAAAWEVVKKLGGGWDWDSSTETEFIVYFYSPEGRWKAEADTLPMAVCLAALKAVGVEI